MEEAWRRQRASGQGWMELEVGEGEGQGMEEEGDGKGRRRGCTMTKLIVVRVLGPIHQFEQILPSCQICEGVLSHKLLLVNHTNCA